MLNQIVLVGRIKEIEDIYITVAISRAYKNANGEYDVDLVKINMSNNIAKNVKDYCEKGSLVGVKGKVETNDEGNIIIIAEKISFLSSRKSTEQEDD